MDSPNIRVILPGQPVAAAPAPEKKKRSTKSTKSYEGSVLLQEGRRFYQCILYVNGRRVQRSSKATTREGALDFLHDWREQLRRGNPAPQDTDKLTIGTVLNGGLLDYETNAFATYADTAIRIRLHLGPFFGVRETKDEAGRSTFSGGQRASTVGNSDVQRYIVSRRGEGAQDSTVNNELSFLRKALRLAEMNHRGFVAPRFKLVKNADRPRTGFVEREAFDRLLTFLPEHVRPLAALTFETGMRKGELVALKWSWVNLDARLITLPADATKNGEQRIIPLGSGPLAVLRRQRATRDEVCPSCEFVFTRPRRNNDPSGTPRLVSIGDFSPAWELGCAAAGLGEVTYREYEDVNGVKQKLRCFTGLLFHDLRRSGVRNLRLSGVDRTVAMRISGHKTESVFRRYNIVSTDDLLDAAAKVDRYLGRTVEAEPPANHGLAVVPRRAAGGR
jgi:integrase